MPQIELKMAYSKDLKLQFFLPCFLQGFGRLLLRVVGWLFKSKIRANQGKKKKKKKKKTSHICLYKILQLQEKNVH